MTLQWDSESLVQEDLLIGSLIVTLVVGGRISAGLLELFCWLARVAVTCHP